MSWNRSQMNGSSRVLRKDEENVIFYYKPEPIIALNDKAEAEYLIKEVSYGFRKRRRNK